MNRHWGLLALIGGMLWASWGAFGQALAVMPVEDAYRAIPQRQTPFRPDMARIRRSEEREYLQQLFSLSDEAVALRVDAMRWLQAAGRRGLDPLSAAQILEGLQTRLSALPAPSRLLGVHRAMQDALFFLRQTVTGWQQATEADVRVNMNQPSVQGQHRRLEQAYRKLLALYPDESPYQAQAFHDHLAALDFLPLKQRPLVPRP